MDEQLLKSHLRTIYSQLRNQQESIGELMETQKAMLEALQSQLPEFEGTFELERLSEDIAQERREQERCLKLIDAHVQELS
jgi:hypothetical protein